MFILVYRLAMDAKTLQGDDVADLKYPSLLEDFRQAQHQWLVRDILHPTQGVFSVFVLWPG